MFADYAYLFIHLQEGPGSSRFIHLSFTCLTAVYVLSKALCFALLLKGAVQINLPCLHDAT